MRLGTRARDILQRLTLTLTQLLMEGMQSNDYSQKEAPHPTSLQQITISPFVS